MEVNTCDPKTCDAFKISKGQACIGCSDNPELEKEDSNLDKNWQWVGLAYHIMNLRQMKDLGCLFNMDQLSIVEWRALAILDFEVRKKQERDMEEIGKKTRRSVSSIKR